MQLLRLAVVPWGSGLRHVPGVRVPWIAEVPGGLRSVVSPSIGGPDEREAVGSCGPRVGGG